VKDVSDGCGYKFEVVVVSSQFEGKPLLQRHRLVNEIIIDMCIILSTISISYMRMKALALGLL